MHIDARWIEKMIQVELPKGSSDLLFLERFLLNKGFTFNSREQRFECNFKEGEKEEKAYWKNKNTPIGTSQNTFTGRVIPFEDSIRQIVYPVKPHVNYVLELDEGKINNLIKVLFNSKFEIVDITEGGDNQLYRFRKTNVLLYHSWEKKDKVRMICDGEEKICRPLLSSFVLS